MVTVWRGGGDTGTWLVEAMDVVSLTMHRTVPPPTKNYPALNVNSPKVEKPLPSLAWYFVTQYLIVLFPSPLDKGLRVTNFCNLKS